MTTSTIGRDIYLIMLSAILSAGLSTYINVQVMKNDLVWIKADLHHEGRRIDRTQEAVKSVYRYCVIRSQNHQ